MNNSPDNKQKDPKILHLSSRENSSDSEYRWLHVNIVFKVYGACDKIACSGLTEPWKKTTLYEVENSEAIDKFYETRVMKFEPIPNTDLSTLVESYVDPEHDIRHLKRVGWSYNDNYLNYIEKFDVFWFREYVEDNPVSRGALQLLQGLKEGKGNASRFVPFSTLSRSISALHTFWD
jgi:hypothetical protein